MMSARIDINRSDIMHIAIGGAISFLLSFILDIVVSTGIESLLTSLNMVGLLSFRDAIFAISVMGLGIVYIPAGLCGGLYTGYRLNENLIYILCIPALIAFSAIFGLSLFGGIPISAPEYIISEMVIPLVGLLSGCYAGGYIMNWKDIEKPSMERFSI